MSPKFKFKFDTVLRHRDILEKQESKKFAALHRALDKEVEQLNKLNTKYKDTQKELAEKKAKGIDISELKSYYTFMNSLSVDIKTQQFKVKCAESKMEDQRIKLIETQKDKKVIDKLKENKLTEFIEEERITDIKTIDDINSVSSARKIKS